MGPGPCLTAVERRGVNNLCQPHSKRDSTKHKPYHRFVLTLVYSPSFNASRKMASDKAGPWCVLKWRINVCKSMAIMEDVRSKRSRLVTAKCHRGNIRAHLRQSRHQLRWGGDLRRYCRSVHCSDNADITRNLGTCVYNGYSY